MINNKISNHDYHKAKGISKTGLDLINQNPAIYKYACENKREISPTLQKTFDIGSFTHSLILEKSEEGFIKAPDINKNTKAYKEFKAENDDKTILGHDDYELCLEMAEAVKNHPANELFKDGKPEVSVFAEEDGLTLKCRPDWLRDDGGIVDLKTVSTLADFEKGVLNHRYYVQDHFYTKVCELAGIDVKYFKFVAVSKTKPTQVAVYELTPSYKEEGRIACEKNLATLRTCLEFDYFSYDGAVDELSIDKPRWMK